jgi:hypothetical protein
VCSWHRKYSFSKDVVTSFKSPLPRPSTAKIFGVQCTKRLRVTEDITGMRDYQTRWREHLERLEDQRISEILFKHYPAGKKDSEDHRRDGKVNLSLCFFLELSTMPWRRIWEVDI